LSPNDTDFDKWFDEPSSEEMDTILAQVDANNAIKMFLMDALLMNIDRHQNNFKVVRRAPINDSDNGAADSIIMTPFDHGLAQAVREDETSSWDFRTDEELKDDITAYLTSSASMLGAVLGKGAIEKIGAENSKLIADMTIAQLKDWMSRVGTSVLPSDVVKVLQRQIDAMEDVIHDNIDEIVNQGSQGWYNWGR
jgi:hypothetical protein